MPDPAIRAVNLVKRFGPLVAVDHLSLEVQSGEVFGLLGPNGAGKTTSISMICGLLPADEGQVHIHGLPVKAGSTEARTRVGVCPQELVLWKDLSCQEQLVFAARMYGLDRSRALERSAGLLKDLGLQDKTHARARNLSGGMKRRLNLALALVHDPSVVVLDEPEAGLDPQSRVMVREYVKGLARVKTVVVTTHNMDEAERVCDRVAIVDRGRLLALDTPQALRRSVGEGDVLELTLQDPSDAAFERARAVVAPVAGQCTRVSAMLLVRAPDLVAHLPRLLGGLQDASVAVRDVRLRPNTLEDVFIALTGRELRS